MHSSQRYRAIVRRVRVPCSAAVTCNTFVQVIAVSLCPCHFECYGSYSAVCVAEPRECPALAYMVHTVDGATAREGGVGCIT